MSQLAPPPPGLTAELRQQVEQHILFVFDTVAAQAALGRPLPAEWQAVGSFLGTEEGIGKVLRAMGLRPDAEQPWQRLELLWEEGPIPDANLIEEQLRVIGHVCYLLREVIQDEPSRERLDALEADFQEDGMQCRALLPGLRKARKKRTPACFLRYISSGAWNLAR